MRRFTLGFIILVSLLDLSCGTGQKKKAEAQARYQLGVSHLSDGNYGQAFQELLAANELDPNNPEIHHALALALYSRQRSKQAEQYFRSALKLRPKFSDARANFARLQVDIGQYDEAIQNLNMVLDDLTYTDPAKVHFNLGYAYFKKGDFARAKKVLGELIASQPENCPAQSLYGRTLLEMREYQTSTQVLDQAIALCRDHYFDEPHYFSGLAYYRLGKFTIANSRFEEVIKLFPQSQYVTQAKQLMKTAH